MGLTALAGALHFTAGGTPTADQWGLPGFEGVLAVVTALVGFLIARRTSTPIGWIYAGLGLASAVQYLMERYATAALESGWSLPGVATVAWIAEWIWVPLIASIGMLLLIFPDDSVRSRPGRAIAAFGAVTMVATFLSVAFLAPRVATWGVVNPYALTDDQRVYDLWSSISATAFMLSLVAAAIRLISRLRQATGVRRQQLKWFVYAAVFASISMVFGAIPATMVWGSKLAVLGIVGIAAASAIAVLRYRLYDIDVVINRTLVYGALTAVLAGLYVGLVFGFQAILSPVTAESDLAIAASTLAVAALFRPVRSRVQDFIDRRFYRSNFDAQQTVEDFSSRLRNEVELSAVTSQLTAVVRETMQPSHVSLWMRPAVER